jgi:hypothetical protein
MGELPGGVLAQQDASCRRELLLAGGVAGRDVVGQQLRLRCRADTGGVVDVPPAAISASAARASALARSAVSVTKLSSRWSNAAMRVR